MRAGHCQNVCIKFKYIRPTTYDKWYGPGVKRCSNCNIFILYDGNFCPCCRKQLKYKPHNRRNRNENVWRAD